MNGSTSKHDADVIVVGAGPAGSIAALTLAKCGAKTILLEALRFPRDKICGDGLIPDAIEVLRRHALLPEVEGVAHRLTKARFFAPRGHSMVLDASFLALRRESFDHLLCRAATKAGAELREEHHVDGPIRGDDDVVTGVVGHDRSGKRFELRAPLTILATGAASQPLARFGIRTRSQPSALALRAYYKTPALDPNELIISSERPVMPGYGWVFPMGNGEANVGVGIFLVDGVTGKNLRTLFDRFVHGCAHVEKALAGSTRLTDVKGAPLRCHMDGASALSPGLLVTGEGIGTTYGLSGEGIGKAMETGQIAGDVALEALAANRFDRSMLDGYRQRLTESGMYERHAQYKTAQRWSAYPAVMDLIVWRARSSPALRHVFESVVREGATPDEIFSARGLFKALVS